VKGDAKVGHKATLRLVVLVLGRKDLAKVLAKVRSIASWQGAKYKHFDWIWVRWSLFSWKFKAEISRASFKEQRRS
jgi:hypothetical protein